MGEQHSWAEAQYLCRSGPGPGPGSLDAAALRTAQGRGGVPEPHCLIVRSKYNELAV
jgi:hypothetical protein